MSDRAYTRIDRGNAVLGNRWGERVWSAFIGNTTSLVHKRGNTEWIAGPSHEFQLDTGGAALDAMAFGETEWSEENGAFGATLIARHRNPDLEIQIRTIAFHDAPGFLRSVQIRNLTGFAVHFNRCAGDCITLGTRGVEVYVEDFRVHHEAIEWRTHERAAGLALPSHGLIVGQEGGGLYQLFAPERGRLALVVEEAIVVPPIGAVSLPQSYVVPYSGNLFVAASKVFGDFLLHCRALKKQGEGNGNKSGEMPPSFPYQEPR